MTPLALLFKFGAIIFIGLAMMIGAWAATSNDASPVWKYWHRYCTSLEKKLRLLHNFTPGRNIALGQLVAIFLIVAYHLAFGFELWWFVAIGRLAGSPPRPKRLLRFPAQRAPGQ